MEDEELTERDDIPERLPEVADIKSEESDGPDEAVASDAKPLAGQVPG
jgi:hypothetical protein